jgi:hypothetical protein
LIDIVSSKSDRRNLPCGYLPIWVSGAQYRSTPFSCELIWRLPLSSACGLLTPRETGIARFLSLGGSVDEVAAISGN